MDLNELKLNLSNKKVEARNFLDSNDVDNAEKVMSEIRSIEKQISLNEELEAREIADLQAQEQENRNKGVENMETRNNELSIEEKEIRAFEAFIRGESRALDKASNGNIIPTTIANRVISKLEELAGIYSLATRYTTKGKLTLIKVDDSEKITAGYQDEFTEAVESSAKFATVDLNGYIISALTKISKSLINSSTINIVDYVVAEIAKSLAKFIENELINGTAKIQGLTTTTNVVTSDGVLSAEDFIEAVNSIPYSAVPSSVFVMNKKTLGLARKLQLDNGEFILNRDFTNSFGMTILGNRILVSDAVKDGEFYFGDIAKAMAVKVDQDITVQALNEKFATQYAVGILANAELDSKVVDDQYLVKVTF